MNYYMCLGRKAVVRAPYLIDAHQVAERNGLAIECWIGRDMEEALEIDGQKYVKPFGKGWYLLSVNENLPLYVY
jgi:hypothetical protein